MILTYRIMCRLPHKLSIRFRVLKDKEYEKFISNVSLENVYRDVNNIQMICDDYIVINDNEDLLFIGRDKICLDNTCGSSGIFSEKLFYKLDLECIDTSDTDNISYLFFKSKFDCVLDISSFNTHKVFDMSYMFCCADINAGMLRGVDKLDTHNVENMQGMFSSFVKSLDISILNNFDTHKVVDMSEMFMNVRCKNMNLFNFDTHNVTKLIRMFSNCKFEDINLSSFNTNKCECFVEMFEGIHCKDLHIENFNFDSINNGTYNRGLYKDISIDDLMYLEVFKEDISSLGGMFAGANISNLYVRNSKYFSDISYSYYTGVLNNSSISNIIYDSENGVKVEDVIYLTKDIIDKLPENISLSFETYDIRAFNRIRNRMFIPENHIIGDDYIILKLREQEYKFITYKRIELGNTKFETTVEDDVPYGVFSDKTFKKLDLQNVNCSNTVNISGLFFRSSFEYLDVGVLDVSNVKYMIGVFTQTKIVYDGFHGLDKWDTSNVITMRAMFSNSSIVDIIDVRNFITYNVRDMAEMFDSVSLDNVIGFGNFDMRRVKTAHSMFYNHESNDVYFDCSEINKWDTRSLVDMSEMFCELNLVNINDLNNLDTHNVIDMHGMFIACKADDNFIFDLNTDRLVYGYTIFRFFSVPKLDIPHLKFNTLKYFCTEGNLETVLDFLEDIECSDITVNGNKVIL